MTTTIKSRLLSAQALALAAFAFVVSAVPASAATTYDFSSSTAEAAALSSALAGNATTLILAAFAVLSGIALTFMGIAWIWSRFKRFTGMGPKI